MAAAQKNFAATLGFITAAAACWAIAFGATSLNREGGPYRNTFIVVSITGVLLRCLLTVATAEMAADAARGFSMPALIATTTYSGALIGMLIAIDNE
jgi:hypothetical protein